MKYLIGQGIDYHLLKKEPSEVKIGGVLIDSQYQVIAHSDGDVVYHAISDAILGALGLGDIGMFWSDQDQSNFRLNSLIILEDALQKMENFGYEIGNCDLTIVSDHLKINPIRKQIQTNLQKVMKCSKINVKATRHEDLNFFRIDCLASVLLVKKGKRNAN